MDAEYIQTPASMPPGGLFHFNEYAVTYSFKQEAVKKSLLSLEQFDLILLDRS
jgi:hypothetical protein